MDNGEIKDFIKNNEKNNYQLGISATLTAIITILINKGITTMDEFKKIKEYALEKVREEQIKNMTDAEKEQIEVMKKFSDLFGGLVWNILKY